MKESDIKDKSSEITILAKTSENKYCDNAHG